MKKKASDFRYNTGETRVPWPAVGENYNAADLMEVIKFMMQGQGEEYEAALSEVAEKVYKLDEYSRAPGKLSLDVNVQAAEEACDKYLNTEGSLFVTNATAGFEIAYKYANIGPGDEVIVPAITFIATMAYPLSVGAKIVICDVAPNTINMDPEDLKKKLSPKTKMVVPVHIGGYPCNMEEIMKVTKEYNKDIVVLEDAAHAFGAIYKGKRIGTIGDFGSFSFHEVKNVTSFGEGGIVCTNVAEMRPLMPRCRFFGSDFGAKPIDNWFYNVDAMPGKYGPFVALNSSTTEIQAIGLKLQVARNEEIIAKRRANAAYLTEKFKANPAIIPQDIGGDDVQPTFHLYLLQIDPEKAGGDVQVLRKKLEAKGVTNLPHFGPLYRFNILKDLGYDVEAMSASCPVANEVFDHRFTHLPLYGIDDEQVEYMANAVLEAVEEMQKGL